jgi:hypothetical protein
MKHPLVAVPVLIAGLLIMSTGCSSSGSGNSGIAPTVSFDNRSGVSGGAVDASSAGVNAQSVQPDASLDPLVDFYDHIGDRVTTLTPSKFRLFIQEIVLYNDSTAIELDIPLSEASLTEPSRHMADFVNDIVLEPSTAVPPGRYTGMFFFFFTGNSDLGIGGTPESPAGYVTVAPEVEVDLGANYTSNSGTSLEDLEHPVSGRYDRQHLGGGVYHFVPETLLPSAYSDVLDSYLALGENLGAIQMFAYRENTNYRAILPGIVGHPETWDTSDPDTLGLPNYGSNGNSSAIVIPFDGIDIPADADRVRLSVAWDLEGIVEVYDAGTPANYSDDIVVLAKDFWNRFSLIPSVD